MPALELRLAIAAALGASAMVLYLLALMVAARIWGRFWALRRANFVDSWQAYLASTKPPVAARLLAVQPDELHHLVRCWNLEAEVTRQPDRLSRLQEIAYASDLPRAAQALAFRGRTRDEVLSGLQALGHLGRAEVYDRVAGLLRSDDDLIALAAWQSLLRMDELRTLREAGSLLCSRPTWPEHALAHSVEGLSEQGKSALIAQAAVHGCPHRVVHALESGHHGGATELVRHEIETAESAERITRLLYAVQRAEHIELIEAAIRRVEAGSGREPWANSWRGRPAWQPLGRAT